MSVTSRLLEPSDIQPSADHYALRPVVAQQHTEKVYLLQAQRGCFALRLFNVEATPAQVEATQAARQQLAAAGLSVGAPIGAPARCSKRFPHCYASAIPSRCATARTNVAAAPYASSSGRCSSISGRSGPSEASSRSSTG